MIVWILAGISITGALFNANGKRIGFWFWIVANIGWVIFCIREAVYGQIPMWIIYTIISVIGIIRWKQKKIDS